MGNELFTRVRYGIVDVGDFLERCLPLMPQASLVYETAKEKEGEAIGLPAPPSFEKLARDYENLVKEIRKDRSFGLLRFQWKFEKDLAERSHTGAVGRRDRNLENLKALRRKLESLDNTPLVQRALALTHAEIVQENKRCVAPPTFPTFEEWSKIGLDMARESFDREILRIREETERYIRTAEELVSMYTFANLQKEPLVTPAEEVGESWCSSVDPEPKEGEE